MDTSEVTLPDEDDRKLFVGGLPQVKWTRWCCHTQFLFYWYCDQYCTSFLGTLLMLLVTWITIGGLAYPICTQDAKQDDISAHFQSFGELDNINLKTDPATGRSRQGITFALDLASANKLTPRGSFDRCILSGGLRLWCSRLWRVWRMQCLQRSTQWKAKR